VKYHSFTLLFFMLLLSCGRPAADKVAPPMEASPFFGKMQIEATPNNLTVTLRRAPGKPEPAFLGALVNASANGAGACYLLAEIATGKIRLVNDSGSGSVELAGPGPVENQQCAVEARGTTVERSEQQLRVQFNLRYQPNFKGPKQLFGIGMDANGAGPGLEPLGSFQVP
jgi:hypothetical protein